MRKISLKLAMLVPLIILGVWLLNKKSTRFNEPDTADIVITINNSSKVGCVKLINPSDIFYTDKQKIHVSKGQNKDLICWVEESSYKNLIMTTFKEPNLENQDTLSPLISFKEIENNLIIGNKINDFYIVENNNIGKLNLDHLKGVWKFENFNLPNIFNKLCSNCFSKLKTGVPLKLVLGSSPGKESFPVTSLWYEPERFYQCGGIEGEIKFSINPERQEEYLDSQNYVAQEDLEDCTFTDSWRCNLENGKVKVSLKKGESCLKSSREIKKWCQMRAFNDYVSKSQGCYSPYFLDLKKYNTSEFPVNETNHTIIQGLGWSQRSVISENGGIGGTFTEEGNLPVLKDGKIIPCQSKMVSAYAFKYISPKESLVFIYRYHFQPEDQSCDFNRSVAPNNFTFVKAVKLD